MLNIITKHTPNYHSGRHGRKPIAIVVHIMEGTLEGTDAWFGDLRSQVSAHYGVGKSGEVHQYVQETDEALHAGIVEHPSWTLYEPGVNPNLTTIGIEHEGHAGDMLTTEQLAASAELIAGIAARWDIPLDTDHIIRHHEIRVSKRCPGTGVDMISLINHAKQFLPQVTA